MHLTHRRALLFSTVGTGLLLLSAYAYESYVPKGARHPVFPLFQHEPLPAGTKMYRDVVYGRANGVDLTMDICVPRAVTSNARPAILYIHGGGWQFGNKEMRASVPASPELLRRGYVVASINYRLAPRHQFPAQIEDAKCAVRFLRYHYPAYRVDPDRIGVWGESAGGHLAALLGLTDQRKDFRGNGGWTNVSASVQAVVDFCGPANLVPQTRTGDSNIVIAVFGVHSPDDPKLKYASPVTYITKDAPPFLIVHGDRDQRVPLQQSQELHQKLTTAGVDSTLLIVTNAGHSLFRSGGKKNLSDEEIARAVADFFDRTLVKVW